MARVTRGGEIYPATICQYHLARFNESVIALTEQGLAFAEIENPIVDKRDATSVVTLAREESEFLARLILEWVPAECDDMRLVLRAIKDGKTKPSELIEALRAQFPGDWTDSVFQTHLSGLVARLGELRLMKRVWQGRNVTYELGDKVDDFLKEGMSMVTKLKSEYERIREVAKRLFSPAWISRHGGGTEADATRLLANKYGFTGQETYMRTLCNLLGNYPDQAAFDGAVAGMVRHGRARLIERLKECEAEVEASLKNGTNPDAMLVGDCYRQAMYYMRDLAPKGAILVHGRVADGMGAACITHAWVELPGGLVFDGVTQRFYRIDAYYEKRGAVKDRTYTDMEACIAQGRHHHFGPWED